MNCNVIMVIMKNDFTEKIASFFRDCLMIIKTSLEEIKNRLEKKTIDSQKDEIRGIVGQCAELAISGAEFEKLLSGQGLEIYRRSKNHGVKLQNGRKFRFVTLGFPPKFDEEKDRLAPRFAHHNDGLVVDGVNRMNKKSSFQHIGIVGPTGCGKTTTFTIPNVLSLKDSMVITDPSGEIYSITAEHLRKKKFNVRYIDVSRPKKSFKFNPLSRVNTHSEIKEVASTLVDYSLKKRGESGGDPFWTDTAKTLLNLILRIVKEHPKLECRNLEQAHRMLIMLIIFESKKFNKIVENYAVSSGDQKTPQELISFIGQTPPKTKMSIVATAKTALESFADPTMCELTQTDNIRFEDLRDIHSQHPTVIFLIVPEDEINNYGFLLNLFYTQIFKFCASQSENVRPVFFLLDEFANLGRIPNFENTITTLRKRKCSISLIVQDIDQIEGVYGKGGESVIFQSSCQNKLFFSGLGLQSCQFVERILGRETIVVSEEREQRAGRSLMNADEVRRMEQDEVIFISGNKRPLLLKNTIYTKNRKLRKRAGG